MVFQLHSPSLLQRRPPLWHLISRTQHALERVHYTKPQRMCSLTKQRRHMMTVWTLVMFQSLLGATPAAPHRRFVECAGVLPWEPVPGSPDAAWIALYSDDIKAAVLRLSSSARLYVGELWTSRVPPCDKWLNVDSVNHEPPAEVNFTFTFDARHTRACWPARNLVTSVTCILCCCRPRPQCDCWRKTPSWRRLALHVRVLGWRYLQT